ENLFSKKLPLSWRFDANGFTHISRSEWKKTEVDGKVKHELVHIAKTDPHPGKYYVDIMRRADGLNHFWIRLEDQEGKIYSVGFSGKIYTNGALRGSVGRISSPDHREFLAEEHRKTRIRISEKEFNKLKRKIENQQNKHKLYFNLLTRNCSTWT